MVTDRVACVVCVNLEKVTLFMKVLYLECFFFYSALFFTCAAVDLLYSVTIFFSRKSVDDDYDDYMYIANNLQYTIIEKNEVAVVFFKSIIL